MLQQILNKPEKYRETGKLNPLLRLKNWNLILSQGGLDQKPET